jgi:hypothetical protein
MAEKHHKWIFGYGLNYQMLKQEQTQPHYGGTRVDGTGGQRGDYLASTMGDINFTVLVEIKTPATPLLQGKEEIRNGAWSLSKGLTDALSQIEANIDTWNKHGSAQPSLLRAAPSLCPASVLWSLRLAPLGRLPWHRSDTFSRSVQEPGGASRRLHAGCRSGRLQGSPELIPEEGARPGFDIA